MAWNEPGAPKNSDQDPHNSKDSKEKKDPWRGDDQRKKEEGTPPDLDQLLKLFQSKLKKMNLGKTPRGGKPRSSSGSSGLGDISKKGWGVMTALVLVVALGLWALSGIYIVAPANRAVVLTFGKYSSTQGPGPHWMARFIQTKDVVDVQQISNYSYEAQMLTRDENIVFVAVAVQYRIDNPKDYLFNVVSAPESLQQATASALRQVIGSSTLDQVLTVGREQIRDEVYTQLTQILSAYNTGIIVTDVALQPAKAPDEVKDAFDDAIKAQEDEQRYVNQAQAYAMGVEPIAQGQSARILTAASAYQQQVVLRAQADVANYLALLPIYAKAPELTRERLYMDAMESVLGKSSKIFLDTESNNMIYLPLGELLQQTTGAASSGQTTASADQSAPSAPVLSSSATSLATDASDANASALASSASRNDNTRDALASFGSRSAFMRGDQS